MALAHRRAALCAFALPAMVFAPNPCAAAAGLTVTGVGAHALGSGTTTAAELSGLTWAGGTQFYAVADGNHTVYPLSIELNPATGAVTSAALSGGVQLSDGTDLEGIAFDGGGGVYVCDETGPAIRRHDLSDGSLLGSVAVPAVFAGCRSNLSLESLTRRADGASLWTANEEALTADGPVSGFTSGTTVRLQKFDAGGSPAGQWAYQTDAITGDIPITTAERSGVADLLVLPNGKLLVLERELGLSGGLPKFRSRIYEVDLAGATDVSGLPGLDGQTYTPVGKDLLWEGLFASDNYEGICLGPELDGGAFSLLLISDDGGGLSQSLYALRIAGDVPEPGAACLLALGTGGLLGRRRRRG